MGWHGTDEYVRTMVPNIGYAAVADALGVNERWLRRKWPNLTDGTVRGIMWSYSSKPEAIKKRLERKRSA